MPDFKLNKEQQKAVTFSDNPLIIIAGAGTGKTRVITERVTWLINQGKAQPTEILGLTFTEKAANEMQERVDIALPLGYSEVWISTFHAFADRILKQDGIHIGLNPDYKLMNQSESYYFILSRLFDFDLKYFRPLSNPTKFVGALLKHFSRLQDEDISPSDYLDFAKIADKEKYPNIDELASAYKQYVDLKLKESVFDFGDLIANTLKLFRERPNVLKTWQQKFKYVLVDEFQDTNFAQYELIKMLATDGGKAPAITVVADDDQSIYRFRGAAVSNVLQFKKDFPEAQSVVLTENYRSNQQILNSSYKLIQKNNPDRLEVREKIDKKLVSASGKVAEENPVQFNYFLKATDEAEWISEEILRLVKAPKPQSETDELPLFAGGQLGKRFSDIAILVRANDHSDEIIQAFRYHGIPYQFGGVKKLFLKQEVKDLINVLKVLVDYSDNVSAFGLLDFDLWEIKAQELIEVNKQAKQFNMPIYKVLEGVAEETLDIPISENTKEKIKKLVETIKKGWEGIKNNKDVGTVLLDFIKTSGYLENLTEPSKNGKNTSNEDVVRKSSEAENEVKVQNIAKFFDFIKGFQNTSRDSGISEINRFVEYLDLVLDLGDSPFVDIDVPDIDAVHIVTVHSAKGLEFPVVFLSNVVQGRFPSANRTDQLPIPDELIKEILPQGDEHIQEERRLFYVGMTRAEDKLYVTAAQHYGTGKRKQKVSRYVVEAFDEEEVLEKIKSPHSYQTSIFSEKAEMETLEPELAKNNTPANLSYSQIETYENCPKQYKYRFVLKVPTGSSPALVYGSVIHNTLKAFYEIVKKTQQGFEGFTQKPGLEKLIEIFEEKWNSMTANIGGVFKSKTYTEKMYKRGITSLEEFHKKLYSEDQRPFMLEQPFKLKIGKYCISGIIDRVDLKDRKDGQQVVEIIDYKTGKTRLQKEVDKDLQLAIYAMAARQVFKIEPEKLSLMFLDEGLKIETSGEGMKKFEEKIVEKVEKVGEGIGRGDFTATPGYICKFCDYRDICEDAAY